MQALRCFVCVFCQPYCLYCARVCPCYLLVPVLMDVIMCSGDWVGFKGMRRFAMIFFLTAVLLLIAIEIFPFFTNTMFTILWVVIRVLFKSFINTILIFILSEVNERLLVSWALLRSNVNFAMIFVFCSSRIVYIVSWVDPSPWVSFHWLMLLGVV